MSKELPEELRGLVRKTLPTCNECGSIKGFDCRCSRPHAKDGRLVEYVRLSDVATALSDQDGKLRADEAAVELVYRLLVDPDPEKDWRKPLAERLRGTAERIVAALASTPDQDREGDEFPRYLDVDVQGGGKMGRRKSQDREAQHSGSEVVVRLSERELRALIPTEDGDPSAVSSAHNKFRTALRTALNGEDR